MSRYNADELYRLLPAAYRARDAEHGNPLRALVEVLARQAGVLEDNINRLYENSFIETCDEWVVPYLGDLLGLRGLHPLPGTAAFSQRARVANTLAYRRRKGTATMLEQLARDTTGWGARAVEYFELLATTQQFNHVRPANARTPDLRDAGRLERLNSPFDTIAHTADVRHIASGRGRHNLPNVGLHLFDLQAYTVTGSDAATAGNPADRRFTFDSLGGSWPLFNRPQTETEITGLAGETNVAVALRRRPLYDELERLRQAAVDSRPAPESAYFGSTPPFRIWRQDPNQPLQELLPDRITIADLSDYGGGWVVPGASKDYFPTGSPSGTPAVSKPLEAAVDPRLGRLALLSGPVPDRVKVAYDYGFSGDLGAGPYDRRESVTAVLVREVKWQRGVTHEQAAVPGELVNTLAAAVQAWNTWSAANPGQTGVITILDNATYAENLTAGNALLIPEGSLLLVVAADWPQTPVAGGPPGNTERVVGNLEADARRPHFKGDVEISGTAPAASLTPGECVFNGLLLSGQVTVNNTAGTQLGGLRLDHCTLAPPGTALIVQGTHTRLRVALRRTLSGPVSLSPACPSLEIEESIVDGGAALSVPADAITAPGSAAVFQGSTVFGAVSVRRIDAGNCLFTAPVTAARLQEGCVRFCHVPPDSTGDYATPRRFRCQPELAQSGITDIAILADVARRLTPVFEGVRFGDPTYARLAPEAALELREGADDGSALGAFSFLKQPQRLANLHASLPEYLRFGLEAGALLEP